MSEANGGQGGVAIAPDVAAEILDRLDRLERLLAGREVVKDFYTTAEAGALLGKAEFTVREWCRLGRVVARKRAAGRGESKEWMIGREEVERFRNFGLLPIEPGRNSG